MDHEVLRQFYHNDYEIDKNVFRSNQPSPERIKLWGDRGIKTIINFRGETNQGAYFLEKEACKNNNIELIEIKQKLMPMSWKSLDIYLLKNYNKFYVKLI